MRARSRALLSALACVALLAALAGRASAAPAPPGAGLGGVRFGYLPAGLGQASDFSYEYDGETIYSRSDSVSWMTVNRDSILTDQEGRFRVEGVIPGLKVVTNVFSERSRQRRATLAPGETKDLGDIPPSQ